MMRQRCTSLREAEDSANHVLELISIRVSLQPLQLGDQPAHLELAEHGVAIGVYPPKKRILVTIRRSRHKTASPHRRHNISDDFAPPRA